MNLLEKLAAFLQRHTEALFVSTTAVLLPIKLTLMAVGVLIFIDLLTGLLKAKRRQQPITSKALSSTVYKMAGYQCAVIGAFIFETYLGQDAVPITKLVAGAIGTVELLSIAENVKAATGVDVLNIVKRLQEKKDK